MSNYTLLRTLVAFAFLYEFALAAPYLTRFFGRPFHPESPIRGVLTGAVSGAVWLAAIASLALGVAPLLGAATLAILFRYFYITVRYRSLLRGAGAVGYVPYRVAVLLTAYEAALCLPTSEALQGAIGTWMAVEFGLMMLCAGTSKLAAGMVKGEGMEYSLVNPFWGRFHSFFARLPPRHPLFRAQSFGAGFVQWFTGVCLLIPEWRPVGGLLLALSFAYIQSILRLAGLPILMVVAGVAFMPEFGISPKPTPTLTVAAPSWVASAGIVAVWIAISLRIAVKLVQYINYYAGRSVFRPLQLLADRLAQLGPVFIWRVFTPDVVNFYLELDAIGREGSVRPLNHGPDGQRLTRPFWHVGESVAMSAQFTRLKYGAELSADFEERLVRYARSFVPRWLPADGTLRMTYVSISNQADAFEFRRVWQFDIDPATGAVAQTPLEPEFDLRGLAPHSRIRPAAQLGSYAPADSEAA